MFSHLKKTILNVTKNVGFIHLDDSNKEPPKTVNFAAGTELLTFYERNWEELHAINEANAEKADEVAKGIEEVLNRANRDKENMELITHLLTTSNLTSNIHSCFLRIKDLHSTCNMVEKDLIGLENLIDELEFEKLKNTHEFYLTQYATKKEEQLETLKKELESDYRKAVAEHEANKKNILEERQKVFQEAFKADLEIYKNLGTIPKLDIQKSQTSALLEEIQLDYDESELNKFFEEENESSKS